MAAGITRKQFLMGAAATAAGTALFRPRFAHAARPTVLKFGVDMPPAHPIAQHAVAAAERIKKATNGEVEVQVFPSNQLGDDTHMLAEVRSGAIQMMAIGDNILSTLVPTAAIDNIGYAFKDTKTAFAALDGTLGELVRPDIAKAGLQPMPAIWDLGPRQITTSTKPINTPEDLKGFKIRVPESPISFSLFKHLGAAPTAMNNSELYTALQTRVVDGEANELAVLETLKFYQVQKYCSLTNHMWIGYWVVMNGPLWKRLPSDHQKAVQAAFDAEALLERAANGALNDSVQSKLAAQGLKFNTPDPAPFHAMLVKNGFYAEWQKRLGPTLWSALEKYTGTLA